MRRLQVNPAEAAKAVEEPVNRGYKPSIEVPVPVKGGTGIQFKASYINDAPKPAGVAVAAGAAAVAAGIASNAGKAIAGKVRRCKQRPRLESPWFQKFNLMKIKLASNLNLVF